MSRLFFPEIVADIIGEIGEWWGTHPLLKKEAQLDIVAVKLRSNNVTVGEKYIIGSCKYRNEKIGPVEFDLIREYSSVFTKADDERFYYIFSKSGFRDSLYALQKNQKIILITIDTVYREPDRSQHRNFRTEAIT